MAHVLEMPPSSMSSVLKRMVRGNELDRRRTNFGRYQYKITGLVDGRVVNFRRDGVGDTRNIFQEIIRKGHDEDFVPKPNSHFFATDAAPGSQEKIEVLRHRVNMGYPLWHENDRVDYKGLVGAVVPRE